jgi:hypothetical protein
VKSKDFNSGLPDCAKNGEPHKCTTNDWPLPNKLTRPLFPEEHTDYHDFVPAACFDSNGKFMDRCNPFSAEKLKVEAKDKAGASKYNPVADG